MASHLLGPVLVRQVNAVLALRVMSGFPALTLRSSTLGRHSVVFGATAHAIHQQLGVMITMSAGGIGVSATAAGTPAPASTGSADMDSP